MHELSVAQGILGLTLDHAAGRRVQRVHLLVGHLRQVVPGALGFAWELITQGTPAEGAELELEEIPIEARCRGCGAESGQAGFPLRCPSCGSLELDVTRGEELLVDWVEIEERHADADAAHETAASAAWRT